MGNTIIKNDDVKNTVFFLIEFSFLFISLKSVKKSDSSLKEFAIQ